MVHLQIFLTELVFALVAFGSVHASQEHPAYLAQGPGNILPDGRNPQADVTAKTGIVGRGQPRNPHTPIEDLSALTEADFAHMGHPLFPRHNVRIKKTAFCDKTVNSYTGYIDVEARHLFFYFFESRNDPAKDDVIFWTNGGPGCSSSTGLFMELGPCRVLDDNGPKYHPESWNSNANIFFIDQPIGVGFSYADDGEVVGTSEEAAKDAAAFIAIFFAHFKQFSGRPFHMASESYGGRYIPLFASEVYDQNVNLVKGGMAPINLTSIMIGNGWTDPPAMAASYYDMACTSVAVPPVLNVSSCIRMKQAVPRCEASVNTSCTEDQFDKVNCAAAFKFCNNELAAPFLATGKNPYDMRLNCKGGSDDLCYLETEKISAYLSRPDIRTMLGVDPFITSKSTPCYNNVSSAFDATLDGDHTSKFQVAALLEHGIRALIYAGTFDWICNWVGNERWTLALEWSGQTDYVAQPKKDWKVNGKRAGQVRSAKGLTFATVDGAGHMVPFDKPKESLELVKRWLAGTNI